VPSRPGGPPTAFEIREIAVLRYWKELVVEPARIAQFSREGVLDGNGAQL